jgi:tetratricopeptide (TPR) repeat protein
MLKGAGTALALAAVLSVAVLPPLPLPASDSLPVSLERLPDTSLFCSLESRETRLLRSLHGRPSLIYVTDVDRGADNPLGYLVAGLQEEYFYWMTWAGLVVGEASPDDLRAMHSRAPFRFEHCFGDREKRVWASLGLSSFPALVLVNDEGFIVGRYENADDLTRLEIVKAVDHIARSGNLEGKPVRDFKLPELNSGELLTLLDVVEKKYTMLAFLHTGSPACLRQLRLLQNIRDRYRDRVSLVAIFQEETEGEQVGEYLARYDVRPDFVLMDPRLRQTRSYSLGYVPVLLVAGPGGMIVLSRKGYQPERSWYFAGEVDRFFQRESMSVKGTSFTDSGRIHDEARQYLSEGRPEMALMFLERILELSPGLSTTHSLIGDAYSELGRRQEAARHYGLYVAANPGAYDMAEVKEKLQALVADRR